MSPSDEKHRVAALLADLGRHPRFGSWDLGGAQIDVAAPATAGDDCAVVDFKGELSLVWGSDYVRGSKFTLFELGLLDYFDVGYYLVVANISDIAAMGAQPIGVLNVVRYPGEMSDEDFATVLNGAREAAAVSGCELLGGDTGGAERLILSASAIGVCERGRALLRSSARPGDAVCLTGKVGNPAAAIVHFGRGDTKAGAISESAEADLLKSWRRPEARVPQGRLLTANQLAHACQDVSDGLRATAYELAAASKVKVVLDEKSIPIDDAAGKVAAAAGVDPLALAMSASVDFELFFTVPPSKVDQMRDTFAAEGHEVWIIGEVTEGSGAALRLADGSTTELPGVEWRHQREEVTEVLRDGLKSP
ncbi:MAG TPA: thiamine-phosphate kinase [Solirubrobacterales bacterium]|nr:thiamine-phosphate kinase [Solirubrobacterales bacterium]